MLLRRRDVRNSRVIRVIATLTLSADHPRSASALYTRLPRFCYPLRMDSSPNPHVYGLFAVPSEGKTYAITTEPLSSKDAKRAMAIGAMKLADWLLARGCEFCAHAVKLGHRVHCDHPPVTKDELATLGFNVNGL